MKKEFLENEKIVYEIKSHWIQLLVPAIVGIFFILLFLTGLFDSLEDYLYDFAFLVIAVLSFGIPFLRVKTTHLILTEKRLYGKTGILKVQKLSVPIDKIQYVNIDRPVIGRILGYSDIHINAITGNYIFKKMKNAEELQNAITNINK